MCYWREFLKANIIISLWSSDAFIGFNDKKLYKKAYVLISPSYIYIR